MELPEETDADPVAARRATLLAVVRSIEAADGVPTVGDLAGVLDVSEATVRRDLAALREDGRRVRTRGHRAR
ncbi:MAG: DeoR family transcriptional regulator [Nitriliruptoraceae bacterium]|nr:DeoR family transcriptional regulator [Nitriliruptoraceae bacterium]